MRSPQACPPLLALVALLVRPHSCALLAATSHALPVTVGRPGVAVGRMASPARLSAMVEEREELGQQQSPLKMPPLPKSKIRRGDYVVHKDYGIGLFEGLFGIAGYVLTKSGEKKQLRALKVRFADGMLDIATRDSGDIKLFKRKEEVGEYGVVRLDKMRSRGTWEKRKQRAAKKVWAVAQDLVSMYATRQNLTRAPCPPDGERMARFVDAFEFEPTDGQQGAFAAVEADMCVSTQPMDRLICGDVGFGKTEVAMRAIYRMVCAGRQVGLLAPTTVLAAQHLRVLRARMPDARVELLSSLVKRRPAELAEIRARIEAGDVDVVVGTHALLSPKVKFSDLGLLVVDEEQRFGVRQKDKIKAVSTSVDVLSLSATPIPRTMYMCMAGIRAMSTLLTPPAGRLAVKTRVMRRDDDEAMAAIELELSRGGQVFYVVPRIEMIDAELELLRTRLPAAKIEFAYGGLADLERRIVDFSLGETDVLVATTIMENGIDIPNVNTIVVQQTHMFGLAQIHQLRGRVGRAAVQAHALLMHPPTPTLSDEAVQRLNVVQRETELGAGLGLAQSDLAMRGAGNVFGEAQKGTSGLGELGLDMYIQVLQRVIGYLERKQALGLPDDPELEERLLVSAVNDETLIGMEGSLAVQR